MFDITEKLIKCKNIQSIWCTLPIKDYKFELFGVFFIAKLNHFFHKDFKESFTSEISTSTFVIFHAIQKQSEVQIEFELRIECEFELKLELTILLGLI